MFRLLPADQPRSLTKLEGYAAAYFPCEGSARCKSKDGKRERGEIFVARVEVSVHNDISAPAFLLARDPWPQGPQVQV